MKQGQNPRRSRSHRGNGRRSNNYQGRNSTFESSGPEGKIRGTAHQVIEKYQALARDALTSGDRVAAENYFQHAEHYFRIVSANGGTDPRSGRGAPAGPRGEDGTNGDGAEGATSNATADQPPAQPVEDEDERAPAEAESLAQSQA